MKNHDCFFEKSPWTWKVVMKLLILMLVLVPIFIEFLLMGYLTEVLQNDLYSGILTGFIMSIIFILGLYFLAIKPENLSWKEVGLKGFSPSYWKSIFVWTFAIIPIALVMVMVMELFLGIGSENSKTESLQSRMTPLNFLIGFVSAAIISPIYEEIFYRGFLYRFLRSKYGIAISMLASSFIFMIVHIPTYNTLLLNFVSGLIFAWTYEKTGSIVPAMIIHGVTNGIFIILVALG
ncbi:CAAX amino terminal protease family protein [Halalkalibacter wakoensis JCM 9140]|uniref:CAAX amino terminal protease family protein n=1 Tax=Halalkalibacter wakoensis JCM 9140 TaxID=1236970 RepID=W4Q4T0_9BACI|nr:type II CAAX endopeptidase family protein [Halalkalibacter wakoensis]GAE26940.1 CAAX amino terminal protease family protein [Halalkalibacter wakoensis JCM 9140]